MVECNRKRYIQYRRGRKAGTRKRNYRLEHACYHAKPRNAARSNARHRARYRLQKMGRVAPGDHMAIHHRNGNALDNRLSNLVVVSSAQHRAHHAKAWTH